MSLGGDSVAVNRRENKQVSFRVSEEDYGRLKVAAEVLGISVARLTKEKILEVRLPSPKFSVQDAQKIASELRRIGSNLNQLTRRANEGLGFSDGHLRGIRKELGAIWQSLN